MKRITRGLAVLAAALAPLWAGAADYLPLPGGRFTSVLPQGAVATVASAVEIAPFAMRSAPVSVAEFAAFLAAHPEWQRGRAPAIFAGPGYLAGWAGPADPGSLQGPSAVTQVSWFAARAYCESEDARLPTWLEWEYAAAADAMRTDARADPAWRQRILSWYESPAGAQPGAVGGPPNAYGVRDLHGLVWEWVDDYNALFIAGDSRTQGDPDLLKFCGAGALNIIDRDSYAVLMRIALLSSLNAPDSTGSLGFRCVHGS
ncbi:MULTISPECIES: formylglycine-generating enzyme family protein [Ramlibacter]|uniref:Formylglycine-generating enzyme family protein n=1 Tax=Ramlibacter aquaticus TaxID=2780094 RepID=A0ABR9SG33_9BURK|nr:MULTISPECIES: formylglycine-generating enzyme family protein [Ramlibacter]MBE7941310.1 formylglycine-generating enzyme family protein [Ramlibacter aquaticus]